MARCGLVGFGVTWCAPIAWREEGFKGEWQADEKSTLRPLTAIFFSLPAALKSTAARYITMNSTF